MHNFQELIIWQKAMNIAEAVYKLSKKFPKEERYGLKSQIRRSAVSIASNLDTSTFDFFLYIASCASWVFE